MMARLRRKLGLWLMLAFIAAGTGFAASVPAEIDNSDCFTCHEDKALVKTNAAGKATSMFVDQKLFEKSIHGKHRCTSCHSDITAVPHPDNFIAKPISCSKCHRVEAEIYLASDHGLAIHKGVPEAASCKDCHGHNHYLLNYRNPESSVYRTNLPATCGRCHGNAAEMEKFNLRQHGPVTSYEKSIHGIALLEKGELNAANCADCHGSHSLHKSTNPASKLNWKNVPATCGKCHENVNETFLRSVHGKAVKDGVRDAPVCTDCHGEHSISAIKNANSKVSPANIPGTCGQCHASQRIITQYRLPPNVSSTYAQSFHGLELKGGSASAANCASCHGVHDILPSSDVRSSINKTNLPQTCGKCHPGIGVRMTADFFRVHAPPGAAEGKPWAVNLVSWLYILLIVFTIGGMAGFVLLDYIKKTRMHINAMRTLDGEMRLTPLMRIQHAILVILFILLAYTGLTHKFPESVFSWPFHVMPNGGAIRALIHRACGWGLAVFFVIHILAMVLTRAGRVHFLALWPRWCDATDALAQFAYNIGILKSPPPHRRWNYAEKAEYWALAWGTVVMSVTGVMLIFTETVLRLLPKVWHDLAQVVHYYEAILAVLAIVVWHFYWVIFDPSEYPINPAWLIGKKAPHPHQPGDPTEADGRKSTSSSESAKDRT
ncbi:MAG: cytochrome b/b6 domain-containing protein [bacterium]